MNGTFYDEDIITSGLCNMLSVNALPLLIILFEIFQKVAYFFNIVLD